ncbi:MAG: efflux RND transporter periplasmic adaptor subunit [Caulobacter sp.]|nr:efflux RND transporter periplasmic adaptor subunit [Caulobacter sp.]
MRDIQAGSGRRTAMLALVVLMLAACGKKEAVDAPAQKASQTVSVQTVTATALPRSVTASGDIVAWNEVVVGAETGGLTAVAVYVDEGAWVRQGQPLIKMNDDLLRAQLRQQEASVASARATLAQADAALGRARELKDRGYLSQAGLDNAVAGQATAAAQLAAAQAGLAEITTRLGQTTVRAPVAGLISSRKVVKGQIVGAGAELFRLVRDGRLELNAEVPETQLSLVRAGMPAVVASDQLGQVTGRVRIVTPQVNAQSRVGLVRISLSAAGGFRPGMFARGTINLGEQPALTVPQSAVIYRDNKPGVFVIDAESRAHFRIIVVGARTKGGMEVTEGLSAGQRIAVQGAGFLAEGDRVRIAPAR